jgi:hypothetical protein
MPVGTTSFDDNRGAIDFCLEATIPILAPLSVFVNSLDGVPI